MQLEATYIAQALARLSEERKWIEEPEEATIRKPTSEYNASWLKISKQVMFADRGVTSTDIEIQWSLLVSEPKAFKIDLKAYVNALREDNEVQFSFSLANLNKHHKAKDREIAFEKWHATKAMQDQTEG